MFSMLFSKSILLLFWQHNFIKFLYLKCAMMLCSSVKIVYISSILKPLKKRHFCMNCDLGITNWDSLFRELTVWHNHFIHQNNILSILNWLVSRIMQSQNWSYCLYIYSYKDIVCWNWSFCDEKIYLKNVHTHFVQLCIDCRVGSHVRC